MKPRNIIYALLFILGVGLSASVAFGVNPVAAIGAVTVMAALTPNVQGVLYMATPSTDVAAIAKWAGMYSKQFIGQMLNSLDIIKDVAVDRNVSRHGKLLPKFIAQGGLRPLNTNVSSRGGTERNWSGRKLFVYDAMKIFNIVPDDLRESFISDMLAPGAKEIPFAQWVWQKEMEKLASEINDNAYLSKYAGDATAWDEEEVYTYDADEPQFVTFGTLEDIYKLAATTAAGESPTTHPAKWTKVNHLATATGFGTLIAEAILATDLEAIATGALSNSNALDKIEQMYKEMSIPHRNKGGLVRVSPDVFRAYIEHEREVYGNAASPDMGEGKKYVYGSGKKWEIRECSWMGTSGRVIMTPFDNLVMGTNLTANPGITKTVETLHGYDAVAKFLIGFEIADLECLYVNNQA